VICSNGRLQPNERLDKVVDLEVDSILRLSFTARPTPKYAHLEFTDVETEKRWIYEVTVKADGKARFDLVSSRIRLVTVVLKLSGDVMCAMFTHLE
jgi:hypothetical protein